MPLPNKFCNIKVSQYHDTVKSFCRFQKNDTPIACDCSLSDEDIRYHNITVLKYRITYPGLDREHNGALRMPRAIGIHQLRHEFGVLFKNDGTSEQFEIDGVTNIDGTAQIEISELPTCPLLTVERYCVRIRDHYPGDGW
jgi:hypothetical protein